VDDVLARTGAPRAVLVGNSRGGYAIRNYLKHGGVAKVGHAILCGTPNHGVSAQLPANSEFNGAGPFLTALNAGGEVVSGVATMTIRSDRNDKFAQPGIAPGVGYDGPALRGATNVILDGVDHRETAYSARAFAAMHRFLTGRAPAAPAIAPESAVQLAGRITGYERKVPTNRGMGGVAVTVFATDPATGARVGGALYRGTTDPDGRWGPVTARRLPWTHLGSMGLSQGLLTGRRQATIRTPAPARLTARLWSCSQARTAWLTCHAALSQTSSSAVTPRAASLSQHQARNRVVSAPTGRPSTKRSRTSFAAGRYSP